MITKCLAEILCVCVMLASVAALAQTGSAGASAQSAPASAPAAASASSPATASERSEQVRQQKTGTSDDRLFWTLPNFLTVENAHNIPRLTAKQKFKVVLRTSFDPVEYPYIGFLAGISQASDSEPGFGQGAPGYAKRYASAFADNTLENLMTGAILPSLLHQDPRYYQLGRGSFKHRLGYAVTRLFVTRSDSGSHEFNGSEVVGSAVSSAIATYSYHPAADRTLVNTLSVWGTQLGWDSVAITVKEFWPDLRHKLQRHRQQGRLSSTADPHPDYRR